MSQPEPFTAPTNRAYAALGGTSTSKPATIYDVAREAGVSHATVTRYLRGYEGIKPATRERLVSALESLDYRPNLTARSLTTGRSHRLGALTHEIDQVGPSRIAQGASAAAQSAGYLLDIITLDMSDPIAISEALAFASQLDLAGVLALASTDEMAQAFAATEFRVPVFIASEEDDLETGHPSLLTTEGIPALVDHLTSLGHRRFLHIAGPTTWSAARNRHHAVRKAVAAHANCSVQVVYGDWSARSGYEAVKRLADRREATAIVGANDQMALGAMRALTEAGVLVPADVSVTGIDDVPEAAYYSPPLTTLRVDFPQQGRAAVTELLSRIDGDAHRTSVMITSELIVRGSTGPAIDQIF